MEYGFFVHEGKKYPIDKLESMIESGEWIKAHVRGVYDSEEVVPDFIVPPYIDDEEAIRISEEILNETKDTGVTIVYFESNVKKGEVAPNDPCPCASGKKYKKCCGEERMHKLKMERGQVPWWRRMFGGNPAK